MSMWGRSARSSIAPRSLFLPLIMAASIPVLLFAGWIVYRAAEQARSDARAAATVTAERVAERVKAEMMAQIQVAQTLALSAALDKPDLPMFFQEAQRLRSARELWFTVELDDPNGMQILNLLRPLGTPLGPTTDKTSFDAAVRELRPVVGGIGPPGPISGKTLVTLRVPVERAGRLHYVLTIGFDPSAISSLLRGAGIPDGWIGAVVDGRGEVLARSVGEDEALGQPANSDLRKTIAKAELARSPARSVEGLELEVISQPVAGIGGWSVHLGAPLDRLETPVRRSLYALGAGVAVSLALSGALAALLNRELARQRSSEKERAAAALDASERQGALAVQAADLGTWRWDVNAERYIGSPRCCELLSLSPRDDGEPGWPSAIFWSAAAEDERACIDEAIRAALIDQESFELDVRLGDGRGGGGWLKIRGRATNDPLNAAVIGVLADISLQKREEAESMRLRQRLADAQEQLQARIARELHDQVGQTVTGLSLGLKSVERLLDSSAPTIEGSTDPGPREVVKERLRWLQSLANKIGREIHQAAADLRPTALDDLGLTKALEAYLADWGRRFDIKADCQAVGFSDARLPTEVETTLYRVAQEALTNVIKHARARHVSVVIERRSRELRLVIEDDGVGFDPQSSERVFGTQLGLRGIKERLALIGGTLRIEAGPGAGASLFVQVPLPAQPREVATT